MTRKMLGPAVVIVLALGVAAATAQETARDAPQAAPPRPQAGPPPPPDDTLAANPAEVSRLFDAYAIVQAQEQLGLSEEQFGRFLPRFKVVVDARRRQMQVRMRLLNQLGRLARAAAPDDAALREQLRVIDDHDAASTVETRKAVDALTTLLDPLQQARYRLFEAQLERRKVDLMTRARQGIRRNQRLP